MNASTILRFAALILFIIAGCIAIFSDTADVLDIFAAINIGLACWVGSTLIR
jgi:hypothetical protein